MDNDETLYPKAQKLVKDFVVPRISQIQRELRIGFNQASRISARLHVFAAEGRAARPLFRHWDVVGPKPNEFWVIG